MAALASLLLAAASGTSAQHAVPVSLSKGQPSAISHQQLAISSQSSPISPQPLATGSAAAPNLDTSFGKLPLSFERNDGQTDPQVQFLARGRGYTLFLTPTEAVLALRKAEAKVEAEVKGKSDEEHSALSSEHSAVSGDNHLITRSPDQQISSVVRMKLEGANAQANITGTQKLEGIVNYFIGNDPKKWLTNIPTYQKVEYKEVYLGIDLAYYGNQGKLEYDLIVAPGADPDQIRLAFDGADKIEVDPSSGDLVLTLPRLTPDASRLTSAATLRLQKPLVYQVDNKGHKTLIAGNYVVLPESPHASR
ncbi:MAG: hypothetical protein ACREIH_04925, partial [Nitrospiraceae bacterium]